MANGRAKRASDQRRSGAAGRAKRKIKVTQDNGAGSPLAGIFNDRRDENGAGKRAS